MVDAVTVLRDNQVVTVSFGSEVITPLVEQAQTARDEAVDASATAQLAAASALAAGRYFPSKAAGEAGSMTGQLFASPDGSGNLIYWERTSGASIEIARAVTPVTLEDYATLDGAETIANKTFAGATPFLLDGDRLVVTGSDALPGNEPSVLQVQNEDVSNVGLRVNSFWEGATGADYVNNDCTLFVVYSDVLSDSLNKSWAASLSNAYRNIPLGVRDGGEALGAIGWAGSVAVPGYLHAGTLAAQCGLRGRAGFQGAGSATTAVVENAVGVDGSIVNQSAGSTIQNAIAVRAIVDAPTIGGALVNSTAIYARAAPGSNLTRVFDGQGGTLYNKDPIECGDYVSGKTLKINAAVVIDVDVVATVPTTTRMYMPNGNIFLQGGPSLCLIRNPETRITSQNAGTNFAVFTASGAIIRMDTYADNAAAVAGGKAVGTMYKTATGEVRVVV